MDSESENGLSCGLGAFDLEMQEHIPLETSALQNFKKMAEDFWVWTPLEGGSLYLHELATQSTHHLGSKDT